MQVLCVVVIAVVGAVACQAAAVVDDKDDDLDVVEVMASGEDTSLDSSPATGRTFSEWGKTIMEWMGFDYDDESEYDYEYTYYYPPSASSQVGYGIPAVGYVSPSAGGQQSSYSSYSPVQIAPQHFGHPARDDKYEEDDNSWSMTDLMYGVAMSAIPIGLLVSAIPTGLFTVALRRRSLGDDNLLEDSLNPEELPLLHALVESDFLALTSRECQAKLFCELTRIGEHEGASFMQRAFYYVSTLTPDFLARKVGLARLFRTSRSGNCNMFQCSATSAQRPPPKVTHKPVDTNRISEDVTSSDKDTVEVTKEWWGIVLPWLLSLHFQLILLL